jgi:hypothetical protein
MLRLVKVYSLSKVELLKVTHLPVIYNRTDEFTYYEGIKHWGLWLLLKQKNSSGVFYVIGVPANHWSDFFLGKEIGEIDYSIICLGKIN